MKPINKPQTIKDKYPDAELLRVKFEDMEDGRLKTIKIYRVGSLTLKETAFVK